jgi:plastocyanin
MARGTVALALAGAIAVAACGGKDAPASAPVDDPPSTAAAATTSSSTSQVPQTTVPLATTTTIAELPTRPGAQHLHFEVGPLTIQPGQNNIDYTSPIPQPDQDGWIVRMQPNLRFADGTVPPVDVVHLHHGVWLNNSRGDSTARLPERIFAAGEEKTVVQLPEPFGYPYKTSDSWLLNFMLHNLLPDPTEVWITYDLDFVPATAPEAAGMIPARPIWMDVQNGSGYPVFDVIKGTGAGGTYTYPDQADAPYGTGHPLNEWTVDRDGVLIATAGHLHPGGLHTDLWAQRGDQRSHLFRSDAKYYEPAGAVSWDVSMTATQPDWLVAVRAGDVLSTSATYDSALASWYESMGIMVVWMADTAPASRDPFTTTVDQPGMLTHGHLAENDNHGGEPADGQYLDVATLPSAPVTAPITIEGFVYTQGDMSLAPTIPTVAPGGTITFDNLDAPRGNGIWHTITSCKAPCNRSTGIAYPLADGDVTFDSGELGLGGPPTANRTTWTIPSDLPEGTYTYFCRIHPLMRGAFRVEG